MVCSCTGVNPKFLKPSLPNLHSALVIILVGVRFVAFGAQTCFRQIHAPFHAHYQPEYYNLDGSNLIK